MGRPRRGAFDEETTLRVLAAARQRFATHGFGATRLEDVAADAGIKRPSLLYHFGTKQRLYEDVVRRACRQLASVIRPLIAEPCEALQVGVDRVVDALLAFQTRESALLTVLLRELVGDQVGSDVLQEEFVPLLDELEGWLGATDEWRLGAQPYPIRAALMYVIAGQLLRGAIGPLGHLTFGERNNARPIARSLFAHGATQS